MTKCLDGFGLFFDGFKPSLNHFVGFVASIVKALPQRVVGRTALVRCFPQVVEAWLETVKEQTEAVKAQRQLLIDEVTAWAAANAASTDWKMHIRSLNGFVEKWQNGGHLSEKVFADIQPIWKAAMDAADTPLKTARAESIARRKAMIEEAQVLGAEPVLHIDAVKHLQQRWQHEAQGVPIERKQEQKMWDAFRKPIDDAFQIGRAHV